MLSDVKLHFVRRKKKVLCSSFKLEGLMLMEVHMISHILYIDISLISSSLISLVSIPGPSDSHSCTKFH
jgi:hypothetical protein